MAKFRIVLALLTAFTAAVPARAKPSTTVKRFELDGACFVTITRVDDQDSSSVTSKTVSCKEYDSADISSPNQPDAPQQEDPDPKAYVLAQQLLKKIEAAGLKQELDKILGNYPQIELYPDLRLKALDKFTSGKTAAEVFGMINGLSALNAYLDCETAGIYLVVARLKDQGKGTARFKDWAYELDKQRKLQTFKARLIFEGQEIHSEFSIPID